MADTSPSPLPPSSIDITPTWGSLLALARNAASGPSRVFVQALLDDLQRLAAIADGTDPERVIVERSPSPTSACVIDGRCSECASPSLAIREVGHTRWWRLRYVDGVPRAADEDFGDHHDGASTVICRDCNTELGEPPDGIDWHAELPDDDLD